MTEDDSNDEKPRSEVGTGLYLSNFIRGVVVLAIEVDDRANA